MIELEVMGIRVDMSNSAPLMLLKETSGDRYLPIWIGAVEAAAIVNALEGISAERPFTHDLFAQIVTELTDAEASCCINEVRDGVFYADLQIGDKVFSARPSDVVALALRMNFPVMITEELMDEVGVEASTPEEDEVSKFREFLDNIDPSDFG